jgi:hypothetical protein
VDNPATIFFMPADKIDTNVEPIPFLADPIDPVTGEFLSIEQGFWPVDAQVVTAIRTQKGSGSAVADVGQNYRSAPLVDGQLENFFRQETVLALKHLTDSGDVVLNSIVVTGAGDTGTIGITYQSRDGKSKPLQVRSPLSASRV